MARSSWEVAGRGMPSTEDRVDAFGKSLGRVRTASGVDERGRSAKARRRTRARGGARARTLRSVSVAPLLAAAENAHAYPTRECIPPTRALATARGGPRPAGNGYSGSLPIRDVREILKGCPNCALAPVALRSVRHNARRDAPQLARSVPWAAPRGAGTRPPWPAREASSGSCAERLSRRRTTSPTPGSSIRRPWRRSARDSSRRTWKGPRAIPPSKRPRERRRAMPRKAGRARPRVSARPSGWPTPSSASRGTSSGGPPSSSSSRTRRWTSRRTKRRARAATPTRAPR